MNVTKDDVRSIAKSVAIGVITLVTAPIWIPIILLTLLGAYVAEFLGIEI